MRTTAIFSYKGGVGKTTTAINLGAELAARGKRVLLVDADGQRNLSEFFDADPERATVYEVLSGMQPHYIDLVQKTRWEDISILPSSEQLATVELDWMFNERQVHTDALAILCEDLAEDDVFDIVLIDCPPSFTPQTLSALMAADDIVVPMTTDRFAVMGLRDVNSSVIGARKVNRTLGIAGVLITMTDRSATSRDAEEAVRQSGYPVYSHTIRASAFAKRMTFDKGPLRDFCAFSGIARDYKEFCDEYLEGVKND